MVLTDPNLFADLVASLSSDSAAIRMRASDAIEKITREHPDYLIPHKKLFLNQISTCIQKEVRWHLAQILPRLHLTKLEREKVYQLLLLYLEDKSSIVRTFAMQALVDISVQDQTYRSSVLPIIKKLAKTGSPAMQSRGRKLLSKISGE